ECGGDGDVLLRLAPVLPDGAHALADLEVDVPEEHQEFLDVVLVFRDRALALQQDLNVDVGIGMQLAAPVAAHREQADILCLTPVVAAPGNAEDLIDEPGEVLNDGFDPSLVAKALVEAGAGLADGFLEQGDGRRASLQSVLEGRDVEELAA